MPVPPLESRGYLPRLPAECYRGGAIVFWTHTIQARACGWLDEDFHHSFRELMMHASARERLLCPIYTLMPDHFHFLWMGLDGGSDQRRASAFFRAHLSPKLAPVRLQHQAFDHVLRGSEHERHAFTATCAYIAANPVRAGLAAEPDEWPFTGCIVPGYPAMNPLAPDFWEKFWRIHETAIEQGLGRPRAPLPFS